MAEDVERARAAGARGAVAERPEGPRAARREEIPRLPRPLGPVPLSFAQERLWFLDRLSPGGSAYNVPTAVRLSGRLAIPALAATLTEILRRHEALRTRIATGPDGRPFQEVAAAAALPLPLVDLRGLPRERRQAERSALAAAEAVRPFDLGTAPLLRAMLLAESPQDHVALLTMHHIVADAWSMGVLVGEIVRLYPALVAGRPSPLREPPIQYADFAVWQRGQLAGEALAREIDHWREALAGAPQVLELPTDRPRPPVQSGRGARRTFSFPPPAAAAVRELARTSGGSLFMVALAGFAALLHRLTAYTMAERSLLVGSTIANRTRGELEPLIGFFVNTLVLRSDWAPGESFRALLARTRRRTLAAYAHQELPFERLVEALAPARDAARSPLVQAVFQLHNEPQPAAELPGLALTVLPLAAESSKFDLVVNLFERAGEVAGNCLYATDLFDAATVDRLLAAFVRLLGAAAAAPDAPVDRLPLLAQEERRQLLEWGGRRGALPVRRRAAGLHGAFAACAAAAPRATAVVAGGERLSYAELDARANRLASHLRARGLAAGALAGICLERSPDLVVAILAILKAGCAYVPLDPDYPAERLALLLADSGVRALVTRRELAGRLPEPLPPLALLDDEAIAAASAAPPAVASSPRDLAYVIYTSGSTGRPKGVAVEHGQVLRLFTSTAGWFSFGPRDVWTLFHSCAFDFSVWELWGALLHGGTLVVVPYAVSRSPADFYQLLERERVTVLSQTPSAFRQLALAEAAAGGGGLADLRLVVFGGEALEPAALAPWMARHGDERPALVNMYGITETTVHTTYRRIARADLAGAASPIGRPLPDLSIHLLDAGLEPVPVGVPGEIFVGGAGVARGYLGRPELTAARFVPDGAGALGARNLSGGALGARLYRSGDLARWLPTGELAYLGRIDDQVKVRGFRIELGEIQAALAAHPAVREAVVLAEPDGGAGERRLVAYVAADPAAAPAAELRRFLAARLPEHMLPAAFVALPELPLTPHGKVDRRALAAIAPAGAETRAGAGYLAPRDALERFLCALLAESLKVERVGVHDGFFDLGGNSIAAAVLANRLQQEIEEIVQVVVIFDAPTVGELAAYLRREHPRAVSRRWGGAASEPAPAAAEAPRVDEARLAELRRLVPPRAPRPRGEPKNPRAVLVLAPPRSGTTLLRVMLGGHPRLFAPPELELLTFDTLAERRAAFAAERDAFWLEGAIRAVMAARGASAEEARAFLADGERQGWSTARLYGELQAAVAPRILVDKTPSYALDPGALARAEEAFESPLYVHLLRHPCAMIRSFEEAKLDQLFFRRPHPFARRELAELVWLASHRNILEHLAGVAPERRHQVAFEDLVAAPERTLRELCAFLGLPYHPDMADPYRQSAARMTDGVHAASRMLGDVKFHQHRGIDPAAAVRWREPGAEESLGEPTRELAAAFGYEMPAAAAGAPPIRSATRDGDLPLSFAQERLWFLDRLEPGRPLYNMAMGLRLRGPLDRGALAAAHAGVVRRHESLRTTFGQVDGRPVQVVAPAGPTAIAALAPTARVDLAALPPARREPAAAALAAAEAARPFDLARGRLARWTLVELAPEDHLALFTLHHIVADGWSLGILTAELAALYAALARGAPLAAALAALPPLPVQYADFAVWQRGWLAGEVLAAQLAFWRQSLAGAPPVLALPLDRPRPAVETYRGTQLASSVDDGVARRWTALGRARGATLFMVLLAAFSALLARLADEEDVVVGTPIANRNRREIEGLIGFFVNTLALRASVAGDPDAGELAARVRATTLAAYAHQDLPFERLVEELQPERSLAVSPVFQVLFSLQNAPAEPPALPGLALEPVAAAAASAKFDLSLFVQESPRQAGGGLRAAWEYSTDLFDRTTVERLAGWFGNLLAAWAERPEARLSELPLLSPAERRQLASWGSGGPYATPAEGAVQEGFLAWAAGAPARIALVCGEERLSYGELAARANRLARRLADLGAGPETLVGVCLPRTPDLVAALWAVLSAGAAYVPLDPAYPAERLDLMLADTDAPLLLAVRGGPRLERPGRRVVYLDDPAEREATDRLPAAPLPVRTAPGNLAYVLYTSGSTGRPKGVAIEHRSVLALFAWAAPLFAGDLAGVLAGTSISFDVSVFEILFTLAHGGRVILAENALALPHLPAAGEVTLLSAVPSAAAELFRDGAVPPSVRTVNLPGEPLAARLVAAAYAGGHVERVFNLYGPSEDTTYSTFAMVPPPAAGDPAPAIGRPIAGTVARVLDRGLGTVPPGVAGELYLGGAGLARGYFGRPDLTAERFVPDPVGDEPGARLYETGDLVRYRSNGELEFLGRRDHQVKIRGFRVEPGEIEAALAAHPAVEEAAVVVRRGTAGEPELAAFYRPRPEGGASAAELRAALGRRLPAHMVPAAFVPLPELPTHPNGKVDRRALARREAAPVRPDEAAAVAPRDALELALATIFRELLGRPEAGVTESFFELGGHSLLAVRLMSRIARRFGRELPLAALFGAPTVERLAALLRREGAGAAPWTPLVPLAPGADGAAGRPPFFCVHPIGGTVFCYLDLARRLAAERPFHALQARGLAPGEAPFPRVEEMAAVYREAIVAVQPAGPYHLGGWSFGALVALEIARQLAERGEPIALLALVDPTTVAAEERALPADDLSTLLVVARDVEGMTGRPLGLAAGDLAPLAPEARLELVLERATAAGGLPPDADPAQLRRLVRLYQTHVQAIRAYELPRYGGPIALFPAVAGPLAGRLAVWERVAGGGLSVCTLPGGHYDLLRAPQVELLAESLRASLRRTAAAAPAGGGRP